MQSVLAPLLANARNADLRRAQLSFGAAWCAEWMFTVGLSVEAYRDGGSATVGLVVAARLLPSALLTPLLLPLGDRYPRDRLLAAIAGARAVAIALAALVLASGGRDLWVYALASLSTVAATAYRPVHSALLPSLCRQPHELAEANAVRGMLDALAVLVGPAVAALLLQVGGVAVVYLGAGVASVLSAAVLLRIRSEPPLADMHRSRGRSADVSRGLLVVMADRQLRLLVGLAATQALTRGALTVFVVVVAVDVVHTGSAGVGWLTAAVGAGALLGSFVVARISHTRRLTRWFGIGIALWGAPLAAVAGSPGLAVTYVLLGCIGVGNVLVDLGLFTLIARMVDDAVLARVFGALESVIVTAVAGGGVLTPLLLHVVGVRAALVAVGLAAPTAVICTWTRLRRLDGALDLREGPIALLRNVSVLRALSLPLVEQLARHLQPVDLAAGEVVFAQGEAGDSFYVVREGSAQITGDGHQLRLLGPGAAFGEIALIRDIPRTATVRAVTSLRLYRLGREEFLQVVTGYRPARLVAAADVSAMLEEFTPAAST